MPFSARLVSFLLSQLLETDKCGGIMALLSLYDFWEWTELPSPSQPK